MTSEARKRVGNTPAIIVAIIINGLWITSLGFYSLELHQFRDELGGPITAKGERLFIAAIILLSANAILVTCAWRSLAPLAARVMLSLVAFLAACIASFVINFILGAAIASFVFDKL